MFPLPTFNLTANIWRWANFPGPPDVVTVCNLANGTRTNPSWAGVGFIVSDPFQCPINLLLPPLTDLRDAFQPGGLADIVEVPAGSGRTYFACSVDDSGKGFANEHRIAILLKYGTWPVPYP